MDTLTERLRKLRINTKLSLKQLSKVLDIPELDYRDYEYGLAEPTSSVLILIADYYGASLDYLVGRSDEPRINK